MLSLSNKYLKIHRKAIRPKPQSQNNLDKIKINLYFVSTGFGGCGE
jgi:hypothetical protein